MIWISNATIGVYPTPLLRYYVDRPKLCLGKVDLTSPKM